MLLLIFLADEDITDILACRGATINAVSWHISMHVENWVVRRFVEGEILESPRHDEAT